MKILTNSNKKILLKNKDGVNLFILSAIVIYILIYIPAYFIPFHSDDYIFFMRGTSLKPLLHLYMNWEGRLIGDYTASLLLNLFSRPIYMAINSLVFLIVLINISVITQLLQGRKAIDKFSSFLLWITFFLYWLCNPNLGQTSFWVVGSAIYLWPLMWISFYVAYLIKLLQNNMLEFYCDNYKQTLLLSFLGFFAGLSNEATGASTVFLTLILFLLYRAKRIKEIRIKESCTISYIKTIDNNIRKVLLTGLISSLIGFLILALAPGNYVRMSVPEFASWRSMTLHDKVLIHILGRMPDAITQFWFAFALISVLLFILLHGLPKQLRELKHSCCIISACFLIIAGLSSFVFFKEKKYEVFVCVSLLLFVIFVMLANSFFLLSRKTNSFSLKQVGYYVNATLFFIMAVFSIFVFIVSPHMPPRILNTFNFFIVLTITVLLSGIIYQSFNNYSFYICIGILSLLLVPYFLFSYVRFTYAVTQTDVQAKIREKIILQAKYQNQNEVEIPDWYFTKLAKNRDTFDLWRSDFMPKYYGVKRIIWNPVDFNYAIIKTQKPYLGNSTSIDQLQVKLFCNMSSEFFDEASLVFEFPQTLILSAGNFDKVWFRFYSADKQHFVCVVKGTNDFSKIENNCYYVIYLNEINLQEIKAIDVGFSGKEWNKCITSFSVIITK